MKMFTKLGALFAAFLGMFLVTAGAASATAPAPAGVAEIEGGFDSITSLLTGTLIPALVGVVVVGIVVAVGLKYLRRGASKA